MTVFVSVKINDGVVLASDSAATFGTGQIYHHAEKIVNLIKGLPVGVMVTGAGGLGSESITTILKDLRRRLSGGDGSRRGWAIDPDQYTIKAVASRLREILLVPRRWNAAEGLRIQQRAPAARDLGRGCC